MKIYVEVTDFLVRYTDQKSEFELNLPQGTTAIEAVLSTKIPQSEVGFIILNGSKVNDDYILVDNDKIKVYHMIIGG